MKVLRLTSMFLILSLNIAIALPLETIHDAVFSYDGDTLAIGGNDGVYLYNFETMELEQFIATPNAVHFIKWGRDSEWKGLARIVVAAHWNENDDQSSPIYSVIDIDAGKVLFDINDRVRWFAGKYNLPDQEEDYIYFLDRPEKSSWNHNGLSVMSPYSSVEDDNIYLINNENEIVIYDQYSGDKLRVHTPTNESIVSVENTLKFAFASTTKGNIFVYDLKQETYKTLYTQELPIEEDYQGLSYLTTSLSILTSYLFLDIIQVSSNEDNEKYKKAVNLYLICTKMVEPFFYTVHEENCIETLQYEDEALIESPYCLRVHQAESHVGVLMHYPMSNGNEIIQAKIHGLYPEPGRTDIYRGILHSRILESPSFDPLLLQPFHPSGDYFMLLQDQKLHLYSTQNQDHRILLPKESYVDDYSLFD
jgi:WD40 repeat protein